MISNKYIVLLLLLTMLGCSTPVFVTQESISDLSLEATGEPAIPASAVAFLSFIEPALSHEDPGLDLYRNPITRSYVQEYFVQLAGSREVAMTILYYANQQEVPLFLAFSLVQIESEFNWQAVNQNPGSVDRGLFQLNNRSFPHLREQDFFNVDTNVSHGIGYMRYTLSEMRDTRRALAMYNAGKSRVVNNTIPASTVIYVRKIMAYRDQLRNDFRNYLLETFSASV